VFFSGRSIQRGERCAKRGVNGIRDSFSPQALRNVALKFLCGLCGCGKIGTGKFAMRKTSKLRKIPKFRNEKQEREFWAKHDSVEFVDWKNARRVTFPNLNPSVKTISLRLPLSMLNELKSLAHKYDVPYQSLIKIFLAEKIQQEHRKAK
jgi:predicted DNA binding CopG/RHH family protein